MPQLTGDEARRLLFAQAAPSFSSSALLLDMDGTLLDIAPTPDSVVVAPGLLDDLRVLRARHGGALAVVTGRPIAQVEALLADGPYAISGEHGGALRRRPGAAVEHAALPDLPDGLLDSGAALAAAHPGALHEIKQRGFVLHYRAVPMAGPALRESLERLLAPHAGTLTLLAAHMAWEVKPRGADKGTAVTVLMREAPFLGRRPVFIGDDLTDEDGMAAARAHGGFGLRVPEMFGDAAGVRSWLARLARGQDDRWVA